MMKRTKLNFNLSSLNSHLSSRKGFTLVELLVVILVIFSVGVLISSILFSALRGANKTNTIDMVRRNGNSAITQMSRMIRYSQSFDGVSIDGTPGSYTTSCVPPIAAVPPSVSSPPPRLGLFLRLANLIQGSVSLGERGVSFLFSKLASIPQSFLSKKTPRREVAAASSTPDIEHPLQEAIFPASTASADFNMGYKFIPNANGQITQLGLRCDSGTRPVRLYDSGGVLIPGATANITAVGTSRWVYADITPVPVNAGQTYFVAVRSKDAITGLTLNRCTNAMARTPTTNFTISQGNIAIWDTVYKTASDNMINNLSPDNRSATSSFIHGQADIGFVPSSVNSVNNTSSWSHVVGAGADRLLVVAVNINGTFAETVSSITYGTGGGAQAMTLIPGCNVDGSGTTRTEMFYLRESGIAAAGAGPQTITVVLNNAPSSWGAASVSYENINQTTTFRSTCATATNGGFVFSSPKTTSISVPSAANDMVIDTVAAWSDGSATTLTVGGGQTQQVNETYDIVSAQGFSEKNAAGTPTAMSWNISRTGGSFIIWSHVGVSLIFATSITPTPTPTSAPTPPPPTSTPTPGPPTPTPIQYHYAQVTGFDGGKTTFHCDTSGIASNSASLIDTSSVDVSSCYFTCSQDNISSPPNIGINFSLTQKGAPQFFENRDSASFQTSVSVRNY